jgi:hypothetical protein
MLVVDRSRVAWVLLDDAYGRPSGSGAPCNGDDSVIGGRGTESPTKDSTIGTTGAARITGAVRVSLNPDTMCYHDPACRWLAAGARTDLSKYRYVALAELPPGEKPCSHCAPPAPRREALSAGSAA